MSDRFLNFHPQTLTEAIRQVLVVALAFGWFSMTTEQMGLVISAVSAVLAVFARGATKASSTIDQRVDEKVAHREMAGTTGTGDGMVPPPSRTGSSTLGL